MEETMPRRISAAELVEQLVSEGKGRIISVADAIYSIRKAIRDCEHTDEELGQLIAAIAIHHGCNVAFSGVGSDLSVRS